MRLRNRLLLPLAPLAWPLGVAVGLWQRRGTLTRLGLPLLVGLVSLLLAGWMGWEGLSWLCMTTYCGP